MVWALPWLNDRLAAGWLAVYVKVPEPLAALTLVDHLVLDIGVDVLGGGKIFFVAGVLVGVKEAYNGLGLYPPYSCGVGLAVLTLVFKAVELVSVLVKRLT